MKTCVFVCFYVYIIVACEWPVGLKESLTKKKKCTKNEFKKSVREMRFMKYHCVVVIYLGHENRSAPMLIKMAVNYIKWDIETISEHWESLHFSRKLSFSTITKVKNN